MSKRKEAEQPKREKRRSDMDEDDSDDEMVNVDFEFFDPNPDVDFHGLKTLLRQLFDSDAESLELSGLADLILSQPTLGSTVKVDSKEEDPYAFMSIVNLKQHKSNPAVSGLVDYICQRAQTNQSLRAVADVLKGDNEVGLILTERLVNMPLEITPPMYRMLHEEMTWAIEDNEPYTFTHYLLLSKTYTEVESKLDVEDDRPKKKQKSAGQPGEVFYFHPEDEILHQHASVFGDFGYARAGAEGDSDSKRTFQDFGIKPQGHMILIDGPKFEAAYAGLLAAFPGPG